MNVIERGKKRKFSSKARMSPRMRQGSMMTDEVEVNEKSARELTFCLLDFVPSSPKQFV